MSTKTKIVIAGIGGVGGYFGGLLAKHYYDSENVEIIFFARGQHLKEIQKNGLKVIKANNDFLAYPKIATDNPKEIGIANLIVICTKSYDLEEVVQQLQTCINEHTILLPLLNGVDSKERIKNIVPDNIVLEGCVYIVSRLQQAGVIENSGNIQTLYFGLDNFVNEKLLVFEKLFKEANLDATLSKNISTAIWEKFIFLSPIATATSYYDKCIGELLSDIESLETIKLLIEEVKKVAAIKGIIVSEDITEKTMAKLKHLPFETTSSMHIDFKNKKLKTELKTLTEYVIVEGKKHNVLTPTYFKLNTYLEKKSVI